MWWWQGIEQPGGTEPSMCGIWCYPQADSAKIQLNCRTPSRVAEHCLDMWGSPPLHIGNWAQDLKRTIYLILRETYLIRLFVVHRLHHSTLHLVSDTCLTNVGTHLSSLDSMYLLSLCSQNREKWFFLVFHVLSLHNPQEYSRNSWKKAKF